MTVQESPLPPPAAPPRADQGLNVLACFQKALGHELPNALVGLRGLASLLAEEEAERLSSDGRLYLERLSAAAARVHHLIAGLAELGRAFRDAPPAEVVSLAEAVREAAAELRKLFPGLETHYHLQEPSPCLFVPRAALRQVLFHLLRNAGEATVDGRPLEITITAEPSPDDPRLALVRVADNGRGMSPALLGRLFQPFPGGENGYQPAVHRGLGLVEIAVRIRAWGGDIRAESEPGRGSVFRFTAPVP